MIGLNINNEFNPFVNGDRYIIKDVVVVKKAIEERLKILKGELAYNTNIGIPVGYSKDSVDLAVLDIIKSTYGVTSAQFIKESALKNGRHYVATVRVNTIFNKSFDILV